MPLPPLSIEVFDKSFVRRGTISAPKFVTIVPRFNAVGTATVGVLATDRMVPHLITPGCRLVYRDDDGNHIMSGYRTKIRGSGPALKSLIEFDIEDDFALLGQVLGWVQPTQTIDNQGIAGDNWVMTGTAEAVLKAAVQANAITRLGLPLTCATNLNRGATITANLRFHPLFDRLFPVVDGAGIDGSGIGVTIKQVGTGLVLDVFVPSVYPRTLNEAGGVITSWNYADSAPEATRVVIGGQGEAQLRAFRRIEDTAREAEWGQKKERFRDARDTSDVTQLYVRGNETLDEGAPKSGVSITLSQTKNFIYGKAVKVGDQVTLSVGPGLTITDLLREATMSWTKSAGWTATPKFGERSDDPDVTLARAVRALARTLSNKNRT